MATITGGRTALDFHPDSQAQGTITERTPDLVRVLFTPGYEAVYRGVFDWSGGDIVGGMVYDYEETHNGVVAVDFSGLAIPATAAIAAQIAADGQTVIAELFRDNDSVVGTARSDYIAAGDGHDTVRGGGGADDLHGQDGDDSLIGDEGSDTICGGDGADTVLGGAGSDWHVNGNQGNDSVSGGTGDDRVFGGQGDDWVQGDEGDDTVSGDLGNDTLVGGPGADRFVLGPGLGTDIIADFNSAEGDRIILPADSYFYVGTMDGHAVITFTGSTDVIHLQGVSVAALGDWLMVG